MILYHLTGFLFDYKLIKAVDRGVRICLLIRIFWVNEMPWVIYLPGLHLTPAYTVCSRLAVSLRTPTKHSYYVDNSGVRASPQPTSLYK